MSTSELLDLLIRVEALCEDCSDISDGPYGVPVPNAAMSLRGDVERAIAKLEAGGDGTADPRGDSLGTSHSVVLPAVPSAPVVIRCTPVQRGEVA